MDTFKVVDRNGKAVGEVKVAKKLAEAPVNTQLVHEVVVGYQRNARQGTASTKNRSRVKGSGTKPWRQKGTGNARVGSRKSPIWRSGGTIFGPKPRNYSTRMSKKTRRSALKSALLLRLKEGQVKVLRGLEMKEPKTNKLSRLLEQIGAERDCLLVVSQFDKNLWLSARNIPSVDIVTADGLDARAVASRRNVVVAEDAMEAIGKK